jgi:hypothetical protein
MNLLTFPPAALAPESFIRKARDSTCPALQEKMGRRLDRVIRYMTGQISKC